MRILSIWKKYFFFLRRTGLRVPHSQSAYPAKHIPIRIIKYTVSVRISMWQNMFPTARERLYAAAMNIILKKATPIFFPQAWSRAIFQIETTLGQRNGLMLRENFVKIILCFFPLWFSAASYRIFCRTYRHFH